MPKAEEFKVDSFQFDDFSLEPDQMLQASLRMFIDCGFIDEFHIDYEVQYNRSQSFVTWASLMAFFGCSFFN